MIQLAGNIETRILENFKKKKRAVKDLGEKVDVQPSFFATISPRNNHSLRQAPCHINGSQTEEDPISNGTLTHYFSYTNSEVIRCNHRLLVSKKLEVGIKIWNSISRMGVSFGGNDISGIEKIEKLERRDMEEGSVKKGLENGDP